MATPLTSGVIRQQILEPWLAETSSDFYTIPVIDNAINHSYKAFCAATGAGPVAQFNQAGDGASRFWTLPGEIVDIWRCDYLSTQQFEIPFMAFQNFSMRFGVEWMSVVSTGTPFAYCVMGDYSIGFHPIAESTATFNVFGPIVPDDLASESDTMLCSAADAYTIAQMAYVWLVERKLNRDGGGQPPANYTRVVEEAQASVTKAKERIRRMYGGIRVAGRMMTANITSLVQGFGPRFNWP